MKCPKCKKEIPEDSEYCPECGVKQTVISKEKSNKLDKAKDDRGSRKKTVGESQNKNKNWLLGIIVGFILIIAFVFIIKSYVHNSTIPNPTCSDKFDECHQSCDKGWDECFLACKEKGEDVREFGGSCGNKCQTLQKEPCMDKCSSQYTRCQLESMKK